MITMTEKFNCLDTLGVVGVLGLSESGQSSILELAGLLELEVLWQSKEIKRLKILASRNCGVVSSAERD
jgi:hypothetical protein